ERRIDEPLSAGLRAHRGRDRERGQRGGDRRQEDARDDHPPPRRHPEAAGAAGAAQHRAAGAGGALMRAISTTDAPSPAGHYSQAIVHQGLVYVAGQLAIDPRDRERPVGPIGEQTEQAMRNVAAILEAAGSGLDRVLQMTIYVSDISLWGEVNEVYARIMGD